jgi:uncharacterized membrane protein
MESEFYLSNNSTQDDSEKDVINEEEDKKCRKCFNPKCLLNWTLLIVIILMFDILIHAVNYIIYEKYSDCLSCLKIFNKVLISIIACLFNTIFIPIITKVLNKIIKRFKCLN